MLLDYDEIDASPMATQQEKWLKEKADEAIEIELYGMTRAQFDEMHPDIYAQYLAGYRTFDL